MSSAFALALSHLFFVSPVSSNLTYSWIIWASNLVNIAIKGTVEEFQYSGYSVVNYTWAEFNIVSSVIHNGCLQDLPLTVPLLKNSSSADRRGRDPSMGMQYLSNIYQLDKNMIDVMVRVPDCMQLISQFKCRRLFLYEVPNSIHLLTCTSFKPLRIMEDKVASRVCNLVLNVMYSSLKITYFSCQSHSCCAIYVHTSIDGAKYG